MQLLPLILVLTIPFLKADETRLADAVAGILLKNYQDLYAPALISQVAVSASSSRFQQDLLNDILIRLNGKLTIRFNVPSWHPLRRPWKHHVWIVDSYGAFERLLQQLDVDEHDHSGKYLIVYSGTEDPLVTLRMFEELLKQQIVNVIVAGTFADQVELWTYVPFAPGSCFALNLIPLPEVHLIHDFFPDKTSTMHGCSLKVGAFETRPYTFLKNLPSQEVILGGFEGDMLEALKDKLNFRTTVLVPPNNAQWGYAFKRNSTGLMKMIQEEEVDFGLSCLGISTARNDILKPGEVHYTTALVISVPPGRPYTSFEKLFRPFRLTVWMAIASLFVIALVTIAVVLRMRLQVRYFVFGRVSESPVINLYKSFFGMALHVVPSGNFARTLLFLWIMHTFVLRTLYQGSSFKYLQLSLTRPSSKLLDDVDATDAHYYVIDVGARYYEAFPERMKRLRFLPPVRDNLAARLLWMTQNRRSPDVMMSGLDHVAYHNRHHRRRPGGFVRIAKESIAVFTIAIYYPKKSMLTRQFNRQIRRFLAAGLMEHWVQRYGDYDFREPMEGSSGPKPLRLGHLVGAFELCGVFVILSVVVFLIELLSVKGCSKRVASINIE